MIDWNRVTELRQEIGAEDFAEVVALFLEEADEVIGRLALICGAKPLENALHFLKGSALNLGFTDLAELCQDGERLASAGDSAVDVVTVATCYATSKTTFEIGLDRFSANRAA